MKITILGAGQVGGTLAEYLAHENNDITVVDIDGAKLHELGTRLDIRTVVGHASYPMVLRQAGCEDADLLVAVTNADEVNMIACQVAHTLFRTPTKIARVRANAYLDSKGLFAYEAVPIDVLISPEQLVTDYIHRLIDYPGALQVLEFAGGLVQLIAVKTVNGAPLVGRQIAFLHRHPPDVKVQVAAIYRHNQAIIPHDDTVIEVDDEVFFITARRDILTVMSELRHLDRNARRVVIAGGGHIGERLSHALESHHRVKIIEHDLTRCAGLSERLDRTVVLHGSATSKRLLEEENIQQCDIFCALTDDDEVNIMSSLLAKRVGANKVLALINNAAYMDLVQEGEIDIAISPQQITIGGLLPHVRRGDIVNACSLRQGAAEAIEVIVHGDTQSSKVAGRSIGAIGLPKGTTIAAVVRDKKVLIAHDDVVVASGDHVVLLVFDKQHIHHVERLFQVGLSFF